MNRDSREKWQLIRAKAELLCMGIRPNEVAKEIYRKQNPYKDWKTGNVGLHISLKGETCVLATISHEFDNRSPYLLTYEDETLVLLKDDEVITHVDVIPMPKWYGTKSSTLKPMSAFFLHEGRAFLHQAYSGCDYHLREVQCRYCGAGSLWQIATPQEVGETVYRACEENSDYHICLGGGTRLPLGRNVDYFSACVSEIRKRNKTVPVWLEMTPPESDDDILKMIQLGVTSFGFNIEIWDDALRCTICPGKSTISKDRYLQAMEFGAGILGPDRVGSCLIVGLEPVERSIEGVLALTSRGIQPCVLPFKPWDKCCYSDRSACGADDLIHVSKAAVDGMIRNGICPERNQGCLLCEGCTVDHDIYKLMTN